MKIKELLDHTSVKPKLLIFGNDRYNSTIGVVMTILSMMAVFALAGYFLISFFSRRDLSVIYFRDSSHFVPFISLNNTFFLFSFKDVNGVPVDPRIAELVPTYWNYDNNVKNVIYLEYDQCDFNTNLNPAFKSMFQMNVSTFNCLKPDKYNLSLSIQANIGFKRYFNFYMRRCTNSTENNNHCYPPDELDTKLKGLNMYLEYYLPTWIYDHYNFTQPISLWFKRSQYKITTEFFFNYYDYFKLLIYESDNGNVFEDYKYFESFTFDDLSSSREISGPNTKTSVANSFAVLQISVTTAYADRYKRFYPKLQTVVANIGGVIKFVFFIAKMVSVYLTKQMMFFDLANSIINIDQFIESSSGNEGPGNQHKLSILPNLAPKVINLPNKSQSQSNNMIDLSKHDLGASGLGLRINAQKKQQLRDRSLKLSMLDAICPMFLRRSASQHFLKESDIIVRHHLSADFILRFLSDFERFKKVVLTDDQYEVFKGARRLTLHEHRTSMFSHTQGKNILSSIVDKKFVPGKGSTIKLNG
jgi:hypothetical protein